MNRLIPFRNRASERNVIIEFGSDVNVYDDIKLDLVIYMLEKLSILRSSVYSIRNSIIAEINGDSNV